MASVGFALGVWLLQGQASLPASDRVPLLGAAVLFGLIGGASLLARRGHGGLRGVLVLLIASASFAAAGFCYAAWRADYRLADALGGEWEGRDIALSGVVSGLPDLRPDSVRFAFEVETVHDSGAVVPRRILLNWFRPRGEERGPGDTLPMVGPGERWHFVVRLKLPHGSAAPGGFDYEAWLLERGLRATGYVREARESEALDRGADGLMHSVHRVRARIRSDFLAALPEAPHAGVLVALAVGDQRAIGAAHWDVFRRTGVNHLVAISGLHISLVGLLAGGLCAAAWRRCPRLVLRLPARKAAAIAALLAGAAYALLAGMGIPVQRALIMLAAVALALLAGRELRPGRVLAFALLCVLLADPWAVLAPGLWLSFGAVGIILFVVGGRIGAVVAWRSAVRIQLAITFAMIPLLLGLFQAFSPVSPLANALAIPLVSFIIAPLALAAAAWPSPWLLKPAHEATAQMMHALEWLAASDMAFWQQAAPPGWLLAAGGMATLVLLLPRAAPGKPAACTLVLALLTWQPARPAPGTFEANVLDVGQGLAVHVQTAGHDLLFDTGPPYGELADAGQRVIVPYLRTRGVRRIDRLVLSHDDADHVGGTRSVLDAVATARILAGEYLVTTRGLEAWPAEPCVAGQAWEWDGVRFAVLAPAPAQLPTRRNNDLSCVIRVEGGGGSLLLVGDIETRGESGLVAQLGAGLASSAIVVSHHGSRTSSSPAFVDTVSPEVAVFSNGYRNPFGHPHPAVWARWAESGARNLRTDSQGSIRLVFDSGGLAAEAYRERHPRYWYGR